MKASMSIFHGSLKSNSVGANRLSRCSSASSPSRIFNFITSSRGTTAGSKYGVIDSNRLVISALGGSFTALGSSRGASADTICAGSSEYASLRKLRVNIMNMPQYRSPPAERFHIVIWWSRGMNTHSPLPTRVCRPPLSSTISPERT